MGEVNYRCCFYPGCPCNGMDCCLTLSSLQVFWSMVCDIGEWMFTQPTCSYGMCENSAYWIGWIVGWPFAILVCVFMLCVPMPFVTAIGLMCDLVGCVLWVLTGCWCMTRPPGGCCESRIATGTPNGGTWTMTANWGNGVTTSQQMASYDMSYSPWKPVKCCECMGAKAAAPPAAPVSMQMV
jgi:hypothetical protein